MAISLTANISYARNVVTNTVEALIQRGSVSAPGSVTVGATDNTTITADIVSAGVSASFSSDAAVSLSVTATIVENTITNTTRALVNARAAGGIRPLAHGTVELGSLGTGR